MDGTIKISLKALRVNMGLSQREAAEKIGIYIDTLRNYENGRTYPDQPTIERMCEVYGVSYNNIKFLPEC